MDFGVKVQAKGPEKKVRDEPQDEARDKVYLVFASDVFPVVDELHFEEVWDVVTHLRSSWTVILQKASTTHT